MTTTAPLLAHLADRFVTQRENLATESLAFMLRRSHAARRALVRRLRMIGLDNLPDDLTFRTQAHGDDQAIPDLVGEDHLRVQRLVIEAKFWAGLTDAQPTQYLKRIEEHGGTLAFIVPQQRIEILWRELLRRCTSAGIPLTERVVDAGCRFATLQSQGSLCVISWSELLTSVLAEVEAEGEQAVASDLRQLQGLCDQEDADAFLPLTSEELTGRVPQRLCQLADLVDDIATRLINDGIADVKGLRASAGKNWYGRYMFVHGIGCLVHVDFDKWRRTDLTPLWFEVTGADWKHDPAVEDRIRRSADAAHVRVVVIEDTVEVPLFLPMMVERDEVLEDAVRQVVVVANWLGGMPDRVMAEQPTESVLT